MKNYVSSVSRASLRSFLLFVFLIQLTVVYSQNAVPNNNGFPDFTETAAKVLNGVVHIKSKVIIKNQAQQVNPFGQGMPDDMFQRFFGMPFNIEPQEQEQVETGSGVIIRSDGYVITNNHVVANASEIEVTLYDNRAFKAKVIGTDPSTDMALLKIETTNLTIIPFGNSETVKVGQWVLAVGNPFNLNSTVTAGIVSAKGRNINIVKDKYAIESFIQTDAAINPGNSGGALVNLNGELIGINTAIASPTGAYTGYGFAVPSNIAKKVIDDLLEYGVVQRAFLGINIRDVNSTLATEKGLNVSEGVFVEGLLENSAAKKAGIKAGDVILSIDDISVKTTPELQEVVAKHRPGEVVTLKVNRDGNETSIPVILTTKDGNTEMLARQATELFDKLGISVEDISPEIMKKTGITGGVKVTAIKTGIISNSTNMKPGCIIVKVDKEQVKNKKQFIELMNAKSDGVLFECRYESSKSGVYYYGVGL